MPTTASDVYAFASVCYEVFRLLSSINFLVCDDFMTQIYTRGRPFAEIASEIDVLLEIHALRHPQRPTTGHLDDHMWEIMLLCWAPSPVDRPDIHSVHESITYLAIQSEAIHQVPSNDQMKVYVTPGGQESIGRARL
jgi:hypothetical protein